MGLDAHAPRVGDERVAGDSGRLVVRLAEAAVDDDEPASGSHRALARGGVHRGVPVDDVAALGVAAKLLEDAPARGRVVGERVVGVARLLPGGAVGEVGETSSLSCQARRARRSA